MQLFCKQKLLVNVKAYLVFSFSKMIEMLHQSCTVTWKKMQYLWPIKIEHSLFCRGKTKYKAWRWEKSALGWNCATYQSWFNPVCSQLNVLRRNGGNPSAWFTVRLVVQWVMIMTFPLCSVQCESNAPHFINLSVCFFPPIPSSSFDICKWGNNLYAPLQCTLED